METNGNWISGIASTRSRWYEKMPSTERATITIVANTGWLIATRVIHIGLARGRGAGSDGFYDLCAAQALDARRLAVLQVVELRGKHVFRRLYARQDLDRVGAIGARADGPGPVLEPIGGDDPDKGLRAFAAQGGDRQRS